MSIPLSIHAWLGEFLLLLLKSGFLKSPTQKKQGRSQGGFGGSSRTPFSAKTMYVNLYLGHTRAPYNPFLEKEPPFLHGWLQA